MERTKYMFLIGGVLVAGAFGLLHLNGAGAQTTGVIPFNVTEAERNETATGNFSLAEEGFANATEPAGLPLPVNTDKLQMQIEEARSAMNANDTHGALTHTIEALDEIERILAGNGTSTASANATSTMTDQFGGGNATTAEGGNNMTTLGETADR